jgi:hypothetical protein
MVLDNLGHEAGHGAARPGNQVHDRLTPSLGFQGPFNALHLPSNAAYAGQ